MSRPGNPGRKGQGDVNRILRLPAGRRLRLPAARRLRALSRSLRWHCQPCTLAVT